LGGARVAFRMGKRPICSEDGPTAFLLLVRTNGFVLTAPSHRAVAGFSARTDDTSTTQPTNNTHSHLKKNTRSGVIFYSN
jgi:hypothetical protein